MEENVRKGSRASCLVFTIKCPHYYNPNVYMKKKEAAWSTGKRDIDKNTLTPASVSAKHPQS